MVSCNFGVVVYLLLPDKKEVCIFVPDKNARTMLTPNSNTQSQPALFPATDSELSHSHEYYQHKANECRELIDSLRDWSVVPDSTIDFMVGKQHVATFKIRASENLVLQSVLTDLLVYYQRRAGEIRQEIERSGASNDIIQGSIQGNSGLS